MTLTPLEAILGAGFLAAASSVVTKILLQKFFVTVKDCQSRRDTCALSYVAKDLAALCKEVRYQGRLLRLVAEKAGVSAEKQIEIEGEDN
jgi:hypothetical protein